MTDFVSIFILVLGINITVTTLSSDWYKKRQIQSVSSLNKSSNNNSDDNNTNATNDTNDNENNEIDKKWKLVLSRYLVVYLLATLSDWMQGPYVYALYRDGYGYVQHDIAILFVAGFGSSMIFGTFIGGMADTYGRRTFVIYFTIIYTLSCITKHFKNFTLLMIGRLLGGVATSLLFSVFDSWLIRTHADNNLPKHYIGKSFSWAQYGNSVIAIIAGLVANNAANASQPMIPLVNNFMFLGGFITPFDLAAIALIACGLFASTTWEENYGTSNNSSSNNSSGNNIIDKNDKDTLLSSDDNMTSSILRNNSNDEENNDDNNNSNRRRINNNNNNNNNNPTTTTTSTSEISTNVIKIYNNNKCMDGMKSAYNTCVRSNDIMLCGAISSLYEGSMYIFVFMWTPALTTSHDTKTKEIQLPFGLIFSTFMVCCMIGSSIFSIQIEKIKGEVLGIYVFGTASFVMFIISFSTNSTLKFICMNIFEMTVGLYFPIMGTLKSIIVPESQRSAIYNLFRIPLNFIVLFSLLTDLTPSTSFALNGCMLLIATVLQYNLMKRREKYNNNSSSNNDSDSNSNSNSLPIIDDDENNKLITKTELV